MEAALENDYNIPMYKFVLTIILSTVLLAACTGSLNTTQSTPDLVGTQVSLVLTSTAAALPTPFPAFPTLTPVVMLQTTTPTFLPTATATLTATPTPLNDPRAALGDPAWSSNLDDVSSWYTEDNDYSNITGQSGGLLLTSKQAIGWHSWSMHYHKITNFYLEGTIKVGSCSGSDLYGLIFRAPDTNQGYFFSLTCDGRAGLRAFNGSEFSKIADFIPVESLLAGSNQINRLGVLTNGNNLSLYANGQKIMDLSDTTFTEGTFGVFISAVNTPGFQITLDEISYWNLP